MLASIGGRFRSWKKIFWHKAVAVVLGLWTIIGVFDLIRSEFVPESYHLPSIVAVVPHWSWKTWLIVLLLIVVGVLLEGSHAAIKRLEEAEKKREELAKERNRGQTPELCGKIHRGFVEPARFYSEAEASVVLLQLDLWNTVQMGPVTLQSYKLTLQSDKGIYYGVKKGGNLRKILLHGETGYEPIESFELEAGFGPVYYLSSRRWYLGFFVGGLSEGDLPGKFNVTLTLEDLLGNIHLVSEKDLVLEPNRIQCAP